MIGGDCFTITNDNNTITKMIVKGNIMRLKATQKMGAPITPHSHFAMIELAALEGLGGLIKRAPKSAELIVSLVRQMSPGSGGVVVVSRETMKEILACSMPTVDRALKVLIEEGWVQRIRIGGASALAINHRVAWIGPRGEIQHAVFGATVIASRSEQDALSLSPPPARQVPVLNRGESMIPTGQGETPPSQPFLDGVPGPVAMQNIDRETGEICHATDPWAKERAELAAQDAAGIPRKIPTPEDVAVRASLEAKGQQRLVD